MVKLAVRLEAVLFVFSCILVLSLSTSANAQSVQFTPQEREHLDSLVYALDFDQLRTRLAQKDEQVRSLDVPEEVWAAYQLDAQRYTRVWERASFILSQDTDYIQRYVTQRTNHHVQHQPALAGPRAPQLYGAFLREARDRAYTEAVNYFVAAHFFRTAHLLMIEEQLGTFYAEATAAYNAMNYERAKRMIDSARVHFGRINARHRPLIAQLQVLSSDVDRMLEQEKRQELDWGRRARPSFKAGLSVSGQVTTRGVLGPTTFQAYEFAFPSTAFNTTREIGSAFQHAYSLEVYAFLGSRWVVGGNFTSANYTYSNQDLDETFSFNFDMGSKVAYTFVRYTLRPEIGLRPYVLAGGGVVHLEDGDGEAALNLGLGRTPIQYEVDSEGQTGGQARAGLGLEYVSCETCKVVVGGRIDLVRNFIDSDFLSAWQSALRLRVGLYL